MRSSTNSTPKHPPKGQGSSASVPLSVYRELAAELQAAQALLNSLNVQNQQLEKQNRHLRQEIETVVRYVMHLQQVVDATPVKVEVYHPYSDKPKSSRTGSSPPKPRNAYPGATTASSKHTFAKVEEVDADSYRRRYQPGSTREISGKGLALAIVLVIVTAFSAGYFLVRPLISSR